MELPEKQLQELLELTRENNHLLKGVHRRARWGMFFWIVRWVLVLSILLGAYYYVEPYIQGAMDTYQKTTETIKNIQSTTERVNTFMPVSNESSDQQSATSTQSTIWQPILRVLGI